MMINAEFDKRVVIDTNNQRWIPSPMPGVERKMLERSGAESGRATSLVRFGRGSRFTPHTHHGGEEFLVLEGSLSDESGDYPAGSYVRNPVDTMHTPWSKDGCTLFVKLWQFAETDRDQFVVNTETTPWVRITESMETKLLHHHGDEKVHLLKLGTLTEYHINPGIRGSELLVLQGCIEEAGHTWRAGTWIRNPSGYTTTITAIAGTVLYLKTGHLA